MKTPRKILESVVKNTEFTGQRYVVVKVEDLRGLLELVTILEQDNESLEDYNKHLDQTLSDYEERL